MAPLMFADGAGAAARRSLGTAVCSGMLAATILGVLFIPALFVVVERVAERIRGAEAPPVAAGPVAVGEDAL
ncbi:MAG: efflux RND transporter permease subunit [Rhodospirillales bacterium]